jgi:LPXTG-motif cell wall-anchored protein
LGENGERNVYKAGIGGVVGSGGMLASTGANVTWWIVFGIVSVVGGVVLTRFTRRRPQGNEN